MFNFFPWEMECDNNAKNCRWIYSNLNGFWSIWYGSISSKWHFLFYSKITCWFLKVKPIEFAEWNRKLFFCIIVNFYAMNFFVNWMGYLQSFRVWGSFSFIFQCHARTFPFYSNSYFKLREYSSKVIIISLMDLRVFITKLSYRFIDFTFYLHKNFE